MKKILIINGPNLNLLGKREPLLYGSESFKGFFDSLVSHFAEASLAYVQSNDETSLIEALQDAEGKGFNGIVLNPAAYGHTSIALADAVAASTLPVVEVHISNIFGRESFRHHSFLSKHAKGVLAGFGLDGYRLGIDYLLRF